MIRVAPIGTGDSQYLAKPLESDKPPAAESKIYEMMKCIVDPDYEGLKFTSKGEEKDLWFTAAHQNKLYTMVKML